MALPAPELYALGKQRLAAGRLDEAIRAFARVLELKDADPELQANALLAMGAAYVEKGDRKSGLDAYQQLVALRPRDVEARRILGVAYEDAGAMTRAAEELERAAAIAPDELVVYHDLARVYRTQKREQDVVKALASYEQQRSALVRRLGLAKEPEARLAAAERLGAVPDDETGRALALALDDRDARVRAAVARALGAQRYLPARGPLKALADKDDDDAVREAAAEALAALAKARPPDAATK